MELIFDHGVSNKPAKGGWCPGWYSCRCCHCDTTFVGAKRSYECSVCAYDETIQRRSLLDLSKKEIEDINKEIDRLVLKRDNVELKMKQVKENNDEN